MSAHVCEARRAAWALRCAEHGRTAPPNAAPIGALRLPCPPEGCGAPAGEPCREPAPVVGCGSWRDAHGSNAAVRIHALKYVDKRIAATVAEQPARPAEWRAFSRDGHMLAEGTCAKVGEAMAAAEAALAAQDAPAPTWESAENAARRMVAALPQFEDETPLSPIVAQMIRARDAAIAARLRTWLTEQNPPIRLGAHMSLMALIEELERVR